MKSKSKSHRGRPVGSGIDDRERLLGIAAVMAANPGMKPTTAIKSLGFTDTSVIRRLRDKLKTAHPGIIKARISQPTVRSVRAQQCAAAAGNVRPFKISEEVTPRTTATPPSRDARPSQGHVDPMLVPWMEMMAGTWSATLSAHKAMLGMLMHNPVFRTMLSQHITVNEMVLSLLSVPASPRRSV